MARWRGTIRLAPERARFKDGSRGDGLAGLLILGRGEPSLEGDGGKELAGVGHRERDEGDELKFQFLGI